MFCIDQRVARNIFASDSEVEDSDDEDDIIPTQTSTRPFVSAFEEALKKDQKQKEAPAPEPVEEVSFISAAKEITFNSISLLDIPPFRLAKRLSESFSERPSKIPRVDDQANFIGQHDQTTVEGQRDQTTVEGQQDQANVQATEANVDDQPVIESQTTAEGHDDQASVKSFQDHASLKSQASVKSRYSQASVQHQVMSDIDEQEHVHDPRYRTTIQDYQSSVASDKSVRSHKSTNINDILRDNSSVRSNKSQNIHSDINKDINSVQGDISIHGDNNSIHKENDSAHRDTDSVHKDSTAAYKPLQSSDFEGMQIDNDDIDMDPVFDEPIYDDTPLNDTDMQEPEISEDMQERIQDILDASRGNSLPLKRAIKLARLHIAAIDKISQDTVRRIRHDSSTEMVKRFYNAVNSYLKRCEVNYNRYQEINVTSKRVQARYKKLHMQHLSVISEQGALERQILQEKQQLEETEKRIQEFTQFDDIFENIHLLRPQQ